MKPVNKTEMAGKAKLWALINRLQRACLLDGLITCVYMHIIRKVSITASPSIYCCSLAPTLIRWCFWLGLRTSIAFKPEKVLSLCQDLSCLSFLSVTLALVTVSVQLIHASETDSLFNTWRMWLFWSWNVAITARVCIVLYAVPDCGDEVNKSEVTIEEEEDDELDDKCAERRRKQRKARASTANFKRLWRILILAKHDVNWLIPAYLFLAVFSAIEARRPYNTGLLFDTLRREDLSFEIVQQTVLWVIGFSLLGRFFDDVQFGIFEYVRGKQGVRQNLATFKHLLSLDTSFFDRTKTAKITAVLSSEGDKISWILREVSHVSNTIGHIVAMLFFMSQLSWQLTLLTVSGLLLQISIIGATGAFVENMRRDIWDLKREGDALSIEAVQSIRTVRSFGAEKHEMERFEKKVRQTFGASFRYALIDPFIDAGRQIIRHGASATLLIYSGYLILNGKLSTGNVAAFILYFNELIGRFHHVIWVYGAVMENVSQVSKIFEYLDRKPTNYSTGNWIPKSAGVSGRIEFKDVTYRYPNKDGGIENITFEIEAGQTVALVGSSGCGKSTVLALLQHLYEPTKGEILVDGVRVQDFDHEFLHQQIAMVSQEPVLFDITIKENILYAMKSNVSTTDQQAINKVIKAAQKANAHEFIQKMAKGYETKTGERGLQISGGQKQRIAIARAIVRDPPILLLDEATSALDAESEHIVQEALNKSCEGRTTIIVAHRLSTVKHAHKIIVMDDGKIVEVGSHKELLAKNGNYNKLVRRQLVSQKSVEANPSM